MKKIKRFLILIVLVFGVVFSSNGAFAYSLISGPENYFKIEVLANNEIDFLNGNSTSFFYDFRVDSNNAIYINGVLWDFNYSYVYVGPLSTNYVEYTNYDSGPVGFTFYYDLSYVTAGSLLQVGDIVEIYGLTNSYDLTISTNFDFDSGYLQYSFDGESFSNFPKYPSSDVSLRYDFVEKLQYMTNLYDLKSVMMYLPNQVVYEPHDTVYSVNYRAYSYNAFDQSVPIDIPSDIIAIKFIPDYSVFNSAPYFRMYMLDIYGDIVNVFNQVGRDYVELYSNTMDFVLNMGYTEFTEGYYNGYQVGKKDGEAIGYDNGYREGKERYGVWRQGVWYTGEQWGDIQYIAGFESTQDGGAWAVLWSAVLASFGLFEFELFRGVTVGMLALIPIVFGLIGFLFSLGGRKK